MNNEKHLQEQTLKREQELNDLATAELNEKVRRYYEQSLEKIQRDIESLYARYAGENGLTMAEARRLIRGKEFKQWRMTLEEYVKAAKNDSAILKELNTLAMRSRITRLESLHAQTLMNIADLCEKLNKFEDAFQYRAYVANYYGTLYDIHREYGLNTPPVVVDQNQIKKAIQSPWSGTSYKGIILNQGTELSRQLKQTVLTAIHRGISTQKLSRDLSERMKIGYNKAVTLVRTELNFVFNKAALDSMQSAGLDHYRFVASLDNRTCLRCGGIDGLVFEVEEAMPGENHPPIHPRCRCTIVPSLGETTGKRTSKVGGKRVKVPAEMNYTDWKAVYIDKTKTLAEWQNDHKPKDFKTNIENLRQEYKAQKAGNANAAELEKTIKAAGKITLDEVKKIKIYNTPPNERIDIDLLWRTRNNFVDKVNKTRSSLSSDEFAKLYDIYLDIEREYKNFKAVANAQRLFEAEKRSEQVKDILSQVREMGATPQQLQRQLGKTKSQIRPTVEAALKCYPREWVEMSANRSVLKLKKVARGHYRDSASELTISGEGAQAFGTAIHEFGHRMEYTLKDIHSAEQEFYSRRTAGESLRKLKDVTGRNYGASELTRKDKFLNAYMGKDYGGRAYELVSMGFQYAFTDVEKLLLDEDMAEWIFGLLAIV